LFTERNVRVADNREFFRIEPHEAITAIIQLPTKGARPILSVDQTESKADTPSLVSGLIADAKSYLYGTGSRYKDVSKAISIFRNAADLASAEACFFLGMIYRNYDEAFDLQKAKIVLQRGAELGSIECNADLASVFLDLGEKANAEKAWIRYFSEAYQLSTFGRGYQALKCSEQIAKRGLNPEVSHIVKQYANDMAEYVEEADRQGISEPAGSTRKTLIDLANYILFGTVPSDLLHGQIKWFNSDKGYGFVTGNDGLEYFLHFSAILWDSPSPQDGLAVRFQGIPQELGLSAVNVLVE
jgi:CspA family cold shock protein